MTKNQKDDRIGALAVKSLIAKRAKEWALRERNEQAERERKRQVQREREREQQEQAQQVREQQEQVQRERELKEQEGQKQIKKQKRREQKAFVWVGIIVVLALVLGLYQINQTNKRFSPKSLSADTKLNGFQEINQVDFLNFSYHPTLCYQDYKKEGINKVMSVQNGVFENKNVGYGIFGNKIIYGDLTGDNSYEAVVHLTCWLNGANGGSSEIHIYTMHNGQVSLLTTIDDNNIRDDYRRYYPKGFLWRITDAGVKVVGSNLIIERFSEGSHASPENITTFEYHWNGKELVLNKQPQKRPF